MAEVALQDHKPVVDHRRRGEAPLVLPVHREAGVNRTEVALPDQVAGEVVAVEPLGAEAGDEALAVGRRGAVRLAALEVPLDLRHALVGGLRPEYPTGVAVEAEDLPGVLRGIRDRAGVAVVSGLQARV